MARFRDWPISQKAFSVILSTALLSIFICSTFLFLNELHLIRVQQKSKLITLAGVLGLNTQAALAFGDENTAAKILSALSAEGHVRSAAVYLPGGPIFASYGIPPRRLTNGIVRHAAQSDNEALTPIDLDKKRLGFILIIADKKQLTELIQQYVHGLGIVLVLTIFAAALFAYFMQRSISLPIQRLTEIAQRISTATDYTIRAEKYANDEVGTLSSSFNHMLLEIQNRQQQLEETAKQLRGSNDELAKSNRELEQFAYIASHDLQEPLRKIIMFSERITSLGEPLSENGIDYLKRMNNAGARMKQVIEDLLQYSRISRGETNFEIVDMNEALKEVLSDLEMMIEEKNAHFQFSSLPTLVGNKSQLRHMLQNLITNSIKFSKKNVAPEIAIESEINASGNAMISVKDNGIGFDEKYKDKIFQPFQRLHGKEQYEGTGIGLSIVYKIVQNHGGAIDVKSRPGEGSTFIVTFPMNGDPL